MSKFEILLTSIIAIVLWTVGIIILVRSLIKNKEKKESEISKIISAIEKLTESNNRNSEDINKAMTLMRDIILDMTKDRMSQKFTDDKVHKIDMRLNKVHNMVIDKDRQCAAFHGKDYQKAKEIIKNITNVHGNGNKLIQDVDDSDVEANFSD